MKKIFMLTAAVAILLSSYSVSYGRYKQVPQPGKPMPDVLLNDLHYYKKKSARLSEFRGKWLILDMWSLGCRACFESFPKIDALQKKFSGQVQFVLVGKKYPGIEKFYDKFSSHYSVNLPVAYDTILFELFDVGFVPHIVAIDPSGNFFNVITPMDMNEQNLSALLKGGSPTLHQFVNDVSSNYYPSLPERTIRLSRLERSVPGQLGFTPEFEWPYHWSTYNKQGVVFKGVSIDVLFKIAFFGKFFFDPFQQGWYGKYSPMLVLDGVDSSEINSDLSNYHNMFDYTFMTNDTNVSSQSLQDMIQEDLNRQFSFVVSDEWRLTPYFRVQLDERLQQKIITKGGTPSFPSTPEAITGISMRNRSLTQLFYYIYNYHQLDTLFIDETGITDNVDLDVDAIMTDKESIKAALRKLGFKIDLQYKRMHTLVFRPRPSWDQAKRE
jgi:thiol-disulfide isomerase/thioredoxin